MPNRYQDLSLNSGTFQSTYAGLPLQEIQDTADTLSTRHYQNLASLNQLQLVAEQYKSKMLPGARSYVDDHINNISSALEQIAAQGGENSTARVGAITNRFLGDQGVLQGLDRAKEYNQQTALIDELKAKGQTPIFDQARREQLANAQVSDPVYSSPYSMNVEPYRDPNPEMEDIWKVVNPDSYEGEIKAALNTTSGKLLGQALSENDLPLFFESLTKSGISGDKIKNQLNNAWSNYKNTPAYKQQTSELAGKHDVLPRKTEQQLKQEFFAKGLTRVFNNLQRDYKPTPAWAAGDGAKKKDLPAYPTTAPGQTVESLFNYNDDGTSKDLNLTAEQMLQAANTSMVPTSLGTAATGKPSTEAKEFSPQYVKDYQTMAEINGTTYGIDPGDKKNKELTAQYKGLIQKRISHPWTQPISADQARDINYDITSQYSLHEYMDPISGKVFTPFDKNGEPTDEFKDITGGDPSKFRIESVYDPKNHYTVTASGNEKFVKPIAVVSQDKDGNPKRFLMSQLPQQTSPVDVNTNKIYTSVNLRPGQMITLTPRVKAREVHGKQLEAYIRTSDNPNGIITPEMKLQMSLPIEAEIDGEQIIFTSPEKMAEYLTKLHDPIYLSTK